MLEIGAGTGGTTWSVLHAVDELYDSYTFTDVSPAFFSAAAEKFAAFDRVSYRTLDIEQDVAAQGFTPHSYDVVIAANVLHATRSLADTLARASSLLRPGGYLVLLETTGTQSMVGFLFGGLPGWWQSTEPSRRYGPTVPTLEWHRLLCRAGFSGADTVLHDSPDESRHVTSCIVSQAIDEDVFRLRSPLDFVAPIDLPAPPSSPLLLIGGQRLVTTRVVDEITKLLPLPMSEPRLRRLQHLFLSAANLLWVTPSGNSAAPRASMIRGITRVVPKEISHLSVQVLGLEAGAGPAVDARRCVEALLRLRHMSDLRDSEGKAPLPLWSVEPECEVLVDGEVRIPRVMPATALNERFSARNRPIVKTVDVTDVAVQAVANANGKMELRRFVDHSQGAVQMDVEYALHVPSHKEKSSVFIVHGPSIKAMADALLRRALIHRVAVNAGLTVGLLLFEPKYDMAEKLEKELKAELQGVSVEVFCVTSNSNLKRVPSGWIRVHTNTSRRMAKKCLPSNRVDFFVDCSEASEHAYHQAWGYLRESLPSNCQTFALDGELLQRFLPRKLQTPAESQKQTIEALFASTGVTANSTGDGCDKTTKTIMAADLAGLNAASLSRQQYLCSWYQQNSLPLTIQPPETDIHPNGLLRPDRTYLIMGGSGGLGLSLTRWMIRHGAQHIVITSRRAQPNADLQAEALRAGAKVHTLAVDVTQRAEVETAVATIRSTMPPIAGVCNLSMVLHDAVFLDMSPQQLNETLAAKVVGTENLDAVFHGGKGAEQLDFFIVTSSAASTIGNVAQANYHAGNLFMNAVVAGRRARGLAASVVHIGWVADTGYITRFAKEKQLADHFRSIRLTPLSETDVQDAFAMAVRASRVDYSPGSGSELEYDITMGLAPPTAPMQAGQVNKAVWTLDPRLMALKPYSTLSAESQQQQKDQHGFGGTGVREQVARSETEDDAVAAVAAAFGAKLETMLQLPKGAVHESNGLERPIVDLGIDSLVAVEIRTWFLKELDTEVPIVKILGGETVLEVSAKAAKKMLADRKEVPPKIEEKKGIKAVEKVVQASSEVVKQIPGAAPVSDVVTPVSVDSNLASAGNGSTYRMQPLTPIGRGLSYVDYSLHQLSEEENGVLDEDLAFWRAEFASSLPDTLPLLPMARGLDRSSLVLLLARLTGTEDICIGVVDANRRDERFVNTLGCFVNMLPLRATVAATAGTTETSPDFASIARVASRKAMSVFAHGTLPLDRILSLASAPRATEAHPLFQAAINYRTAGGGGINIWDLPLGSDDARMELSWLGAKEAENPYDVSLGFFEMPGGGCLAQIWCSATLYGPEACRSLMDVYLRLLEAVARDPEVSVDRLALYDDSDARVLRALEVGRGPETKFDWVNTGSSLCLSRRVRDMCRSHPGRIAVTDAVASLSYSQLAEQTSRLTHRLKEAGVHARHVAVLCEPSIDGIVAMLAVLEAGAVYVPLDVSLPASRHADMLRLCEPALVLFHTPTEQRLNALLDDVVVGEQHEKPRALQVDVDHPQDDSYTHDDLNDSNKIYPAFLLFTSGSTGTPNGVHLTQLNFANHIALKTQTFSLAHTDHVLQQSSLGFDMALIQTFSALANGACLVIAPTDIRRDPVAIAALLRREAVSMTIATPTEYLAWIHAAADVLSASTEASTGKGDGSSTWRLAFSGGEQIPPRLITELGRLGIPGLRLTNCYGPTEITAAATFQPIPLGNDDKTSSISCLASPSTPSAIWRPYAVGKALPNYTVIIIDPFTLTTAPQPLPLGQTGEICIGGAGVALGYLHRPDLTRTRFLTDVLGDKKGTVYRTGDKGRLLADGTLLCLGRLDGDTQIKLRGQRVDLQEIEAAILRASAGVIASVVVSRRHDILIAHATLADDVDPTTWQDDGSISSSSSILSRVRLSQAFIPAAIYILKTLPSTPNGKLDRKAIAQLRLLWERVLPSLGSKRIGPSSDFFLCGGNSLLLMKLQKAIKETTGVEISTKRMYEATTLRAMTRAVFE
ncbi:hypothetical protein BDP55DRAFT_567859, partial [Colletotrichum godetiae]